MALGNRVGRMLGRPASKPNARTVTERKPLTERGRFGVSILAILKNEAPYMEEWLCHHMAIGVDHFFLYDNDSSDELHQVLKPYADHGIVTTVYFPMRGLQRDANNHVVRFFGATTEWLAYVDIDEFLVPQQDEQIGSVMSRYPDASQVLVSRAEMCYSGHRTPPPGLITENYRQRSENVPRMGSSAVLAKPIVRPQRTFRVGIHYAVTIDGKTTNTAGTFIEEEANNIVEPSYANLQMNHYYTKSYEEFQAKRSRTTTSTHSFPLPDVPFDIPAEPDHAIDRWIPRTKALMEEMRTLDRSPSRYGSRLRMTGFPKADQFAPEAITVVSNEVSGVQEVKRKRAFKSLPLPNVRGALARAEDHGYEPTLGRFLASPHLAQEMAWLAASVTWSLAEPGATLIVEPGVGAGDGGSYSVDFGGPSGSLVIPAGGLPLRCHALAFVLQVPGITQIEVSTEELDGWQPGPAFELTGEGTYVGLVALDKLPHTIKQVRLTLSGAAQVTLYDLALLTFG